MHLAGYITFVALFTTLSSLGQEKIDWSPDYRLQPKDFRGTAPNTGTMQTIYGHSVIEYGFMNYQLLFSNLNANVRCSFIPTASWLDEGDATNKLLGYAQVTWNLNELAARKLRKLFHENRMKLNPNTMNEFYEQVISEIAEIQAQYSRETDFGNDDARQAEWETRVNALLSEYADYCQTCKAPKKKKKQKKSR